MGRRLIGAHVSSAGGLSNAVANGKKLGCSAIQLFGSSPRSWAFKMPSKEEIGKFLKAKQNSEIRFVALHSIYLINLASPDRQARLRSIGSLVNYLQLGQLIGADGVVTHIGTAAKLTEEEAIKNSAEAIEKVLGETPGGINIILEVTAGSGSTIGSRYEHFQEIYKRVGDSKLRKRIKVCWDTAHTFASGYDLANDLGGVLRMFDLLIGLNRMAVVHFNDSKVDFDSKVDRHENIGEGKIGYRAMKRVINHPKLRTLPFILEVPGFGGSGPDVKNMQIVKNMVT